MNFNYSKLTTLDMMEFYLLAMRGQWGRSAGILALIAKTGVDLTTIPASETAQLVEIFWKGFPEYVNQVKIEQLFKGESDVS